MPLMTRGWTIQERILPSRTVLFTSTEVFCECYNTIACESSPDRCFITQKDDIFGDLASKNKLNRKSWASIVARYSRMSLTFSSDRAVAISGIAKILIEQTGIPYQAGLWQDTLLHDLLWRASLSCRSRPKNYRPPTWSWLSVDGGVHISEQKPNNLGLDWVVEIIDVNLVSPESFSSFTDGILTLRCTSMLKSTREHLRGVKIQYLDDGASKFKENLSLFFSPDESEWYQEDPEKPPQVFHLLPFYGHGNRSTGGGGSSTGMMVIRSVEHGNGHYVRVGIFSQLSIPNYRGAESCVSQAQTNEDGKFRELRETAPVAEEKSDDFPWTQIFDWNEPGSRLTNTLPVTPDDYVYTETKEGKRWGVIKIH